MKILITEEALETRSGHFANYISTIARGLRSLGHEVDVLAHRNADQIVLRQTGSQPWFRRNCRTDVRSKGLNGFVTHNYSSWLDLRRWLDTRPDYDWVLQLATRRHHMGAFALAARNRNYLPHGRFMMLFVHGFAAYGGRDRPVVFKNTQAAVLARMLFRMMRSLVASGRIVIAAETKAMQTELEAFTKMPVTLMPHPVATEEDLRAAVTGSSEQSIPRPLVVTCPGFARFEKGSDLLLDAVRLLARRQRAGGFSFVLQWLEAFSDPAGKVYAPDDALEQSGLVKFIREPIDEESYARLLSETDLMVMPYRRSSYHNRVSRVAIEAATMGIPMIYMKDTWLDEVAEIVGGGVQIEDESVEALYESLLRARDAYAALRVKATAGAGNARNYFSVNCLNDILEGFGTR